MEQYLVVSEIAICEQALEKEAPLQLLRIEAEHARELIFSAATILKIISSIADTNVSSCIAHALS